MCIFVTTFHVILSTASEKSREWPYMLDYVAVQVPPDDWNDASIAWWYGLVALATGFVHITHIQFLAMLYPSNLEAKLILALMGPLVLVSAVTELIPMHTKDTPSKLADLSDAIQGICNATLSLLYTIALIIWGFIVNRKQAWRLEGGTAAFGGAALILAMNSTALSFIQLSRIGPFVWLTSLLHTSIVWQNFVSWWWWVGAGMSETYEDNFKARDRKRQYKNRMKSQKQRKAHGSVHVFDLLWKRGTRKGAALADLQANPVEEDAVADTNISGTASGTDITPGGEQSPQRRASSRNASYDDTNSPSSSNPLTREEDHFSDPNQEAEAEPEHDTQLDTSSGIFSLRAWWHTLRRAHRNAVRVQHLERVVLNSRRQRYQQRYYESPYANEARALEALEEIERERVREEGQQQQRRKERERAGGRSAFWWGPFERWRFRDRTVY